MEILWQLSLGHLWGTCPSEDPGYTITEWPVCQRRQSATWRTSPTWIVSNRLTTLPQISSELVPLMTACPEAWTFHQKNYSDQLTASGLFRSVALCTFFSCQYLHIGSGVLLCTCTFDGVVPLSFDEVQFTGPPCVRYNDSFCVCVVHTLCACVWARMHPCLWNEGSRCLCVHVRGGRAFINWRQILLLENLERNDKIYQPQLSSHRHQCSMLSTTTDVLLWSLFSPLSGSSGGGKSICIFIK